MLLFLTIQCTVTLALRLTQSNTYVSVNGEEQQKTDGCYDMSIHHCNCTETQQQCTEEHHIWTACDSCTTQRTAQQEFQGIYDKMQIEAIYSDGNTVKQTPMPESLGKQTEPIILGLNHCHENRGSFSKLSVAGMTSSGTHTLWASLRDNCALPDPIFFKGDKVELLSPDVTPSTYTYLSVNGLGCYDMNVHHCECNTNQKACEASGKLWTNCNSCSAQQTAKEEHKQTMRVVIVKEPLQWMASSCRKKFWKEAMPSPDTCPFPMNSQNASKLTYFGVESESMVDAWGKWVSEYHENDESQTQRAVMIRYEDLLFKPEKTISQVCECVGGTAKRGKDFHVMESSTSQANRGSSSAATTRDGAIDRYVNQRASILTHMTAEDKKYMEHVLAKTGANKIMEKFHYTLD